MRLLFFILFLTSSLNILNAQDMKIIGLTTEDTYDWGVKYPKEKHLKASLKITNTSDIPLILRDIKPGCSCVTYNIDKYTINKNDTAELNVTLNTSGYKGQVQKLVTLHSNSIENPEFYLLVRTYVLYPIAFTPSEHFYFPELKVNDAQTQSIIIRNTLDKPIKIVDYYVPNTDINISINKGDVINAKDSIELKVTLKAEKTSNNYFEVLHFKTDAEEDPSFKVYVRGMFKK